MFLFPVLLGLCKNTVSLVLVHSLLSKDRNEAKREEFSRNQMSTIDGQAAFIVRCGGRLSLIGSVLRNLQKKCSSCYLLAVCSACFRYFQFSLSCLTACCVKTPWFWQILRSFKQFPLKTSTSRACHWLSTVNDLLALPCSTSLLFPSICAKN